jgi:hypothetical protein
MSCIVNWGPQIFLVPVQSPMLPTYLCLETGLAKGESVPPDGPRCGDNSCGEVTRLSEGGRQAPKRGVHLAICVRSRNLIYYSLFLVHWWISNYVLLIFCTKKSYFIPLLKIKSCCGLHTVIAIQIYNIDH